MRKGMGFSLDLNSIISKGLSTGLEELKNTALTEATKQALANQDVQQAIQSSTQKAAVQQTADYLTKYGKEILIGGTITAGVMAYLLYSRFARR